MCNRRIPQCKHFFYDLQYQPLFPLQKDKTLRRRLHSGGEDDAQMQCPAAGCSFNITLEKSTNRKRSMIISWDTRTPPAPLRRVHNPDDSNRHSTNLPLRSARVKHLVLKAEVLILIHPGSRNGEGTSLESRHSDWTRFGVLHQSPVKSASSRQVKRDTRVCFIPSAARFSFASTESVKGAREVRRWEQAHLPEKPSSEH